MQQVKDDTLEPGTPEEQIPRFKTELEKFTLLLESKTIPKHETGEWLRKNGLHSEHLTVWEQELAHRMADKEVDIKSVQQENKNLKNALKKAKKEKDQLEKALAECPPSMHLKKSGSDLWGQRGRLTTQAERQNAIDLVEEAKEQGARISKACGCLGISVRTFKRWKSGRIIDQRKGAEKHIPKKLTQEERQAIIDACCSREYQDLTPYEIQVILLEKKIYIASVRLSIGLPSRQ
jgi:transposase-like protein